MKTCPVCDTDYPDQHTTCDTDGAVLILSRELAPGTLVRGKYRIVRKIGQGGMGIVYLAEDSLLGVKVALKFLAGDLGKDPRFIKRFRTEARAAYQLRHPNIAEVTNLDQAEDGSLFIAMEYIEGPSLRFLLDQNPKGLAVPRALEIARGIASGLAAAHDQGTVHRDIKPENILITPLSDGSGRASEGIERAKVLDFGIAAVAENLTKMTRTQGFILTYAYAAPEQWQEMPADQMDGRTDLYALGCVFYEMLTGEPPFHAHTTAGWMKQHCEETPKPPSTLRPELANWTNLDALLAILLAKDRNRRPKDALELVTLLRAVHPRPSIPEPAPEPKWQKTQIEVRQGRWELASRRIPNVLISSWKLLKVRIAVGVVLFFLAFHFLLPIVLLEACWHNMPDLAETGARLYRPPDLKSLDNYGEDWATAYGTPTTERNIVDLIVFNCAHFDDGFGEGCLHAAKLRNLYGGSVFTLSEALALTNRAADILAATCFQTSGNSTGHHCEQLGDLYAGTNPIIRDDVRAIFPRDTEKAIAAYRRGCEKENYTCDAMKRKVGALAHAASTKQLPSSTDQLPN